jgi:hypothetical protein
MIVCLHRQRQPFRPNESITANPSIHPSPPFSPKKESVPIVVYWPPFHPLASINKFLNCASRRSPLSLARFRSRSMVQNPAWRQLTDSLALWLVTLDAFLFFGRCSLYDWFPREPSGRPSVGYHSSVSSVLHGYIYVSHVTLNEMNKSSIDALEQSMKWASSFQENVCLPATQQSKSSNSSVVACMKHPTFNLPS